MPNHRTAHRARRGALRGFLPTARSRRASGCWAPGRWAPGRWAAALVGLVALSVCLAGCQPAAPSAAPDPSAADKTPIGELWDTYFLNGAKIGYGHTILRQTERAGQARLETESISRLTLERFGQTVEQDLRLTTEETPSGQLVSFRIEAAFGPSPLVVTGHVAGDHLRIITQTQGHQQEATLGWSPEIRGFFGVDQSLAARPMQVEEKRSLRVLWPLLNQVADVELTAIGLETTSLLDGGKELMRVETSARLPDGNVLAETLWTDSQGQVMKRLIPGIGQASYRTTEQVAKSDAPAGAPSLDIGLDTLVAVSPPLENAHRTRQVRYRLTLDHADPLKTFAAGATQALQAVDARTVELTVRSLRPGAAADSRAEPVQAPGTEYLAANSVLQTDDPRVRALAVEARGTLTDPARIAVALERFVHDTMRSSDFSQAFATAAEVAASRSGDCTEYAVLLAALARANGIASRVAVGLVYVERAGGFGFHMWTEVFIDGQWVPLDATLGQGGIGAAHIKLVDSSLEGASAYSAFLPVANVLGQLKIEVLDVE